MIKITQKEAQLNKAKLENAMVVLKQLANLAPNKVYYDTDIREIIANTSVFTTEELAAAKEESLITVLCDKIIQTVNEHNVTNTLKYGDYIFVHVNGQKYAKLKVADGLLWELCDSKIFGKNYVSKLVKLNWEYERLLSVLKLIIGRNYVIKQLRS
ncbi:hypothetical protein MA9V1_014 [Chryseobacterium phage MA9V-1]|nr:hypothetical protein MA9V1_014 [Chryseobacterium phage MA9V-1]